MDVPDDNSLYFGALVYGLVTPKKPKNAVLNFKKTDWPPKDEEEPKVH